MLIIRLPFDGDGLNMMMTLLESLCLGIPADTPRAFYFQYIGLESALPCLFIFSILEAVFSHASRAKRCRCLLILGYATMIIFAYLLHKPRRLMDTYIFTRCSR